MESLLDGRNRAFDLHVHAIACSANDREAVRFRELNVSVRPTPWLTVLAGGG
jgi:hypothetical protein